jgi:hypothetical protein
LFFVLFWGKCNSNILGKTKLLGGGKMKHSRFKSLGYIFGSFHTSFLDIVVLFFGHFAAIVLLLLHNPPILDILSSFSITSSSPRGPLSSLRLSHHHHVFAPTPTNWNIRDCAVHSIPLANSEEEDICWLNDRPFPFPRLRHRFPFLPKPLSSLLPNAAGEATRILC